MKLVELSSEEITNLFENKFLKLSQEHIIDLNKDNLVLNYNGYIYKPISMNIKFSEKIIENKHIIDYLKNIICKHFNLQHYEVIYVSRSNQEFEFMIRFTPDKICPIVVCEYRQALENMRAISNRKIKTNVDSQFIGIYKKIGESLYYFRWIDNI